MAPRLRSSALRATLDGSDGSFRLLADGLHADAGEVVAITGESGTGKTLLLEMLGLLRRPDAGSSCILNMPGGDCIDILDGWTARNGAAMLARLRRQMFGFVPQSGGLLPYLDVAANVALSQRLGGMYDPAHCDRMMGALGLSRHGRSMPDALSIGERQRVAIARALVHGPLLVIADEPTAALDPRLSRDVMQLFLDLAAAQGTTVILSTHDLGLARDLGLRRLVCHVDPAKSGPGTVTSRLADAAALPAEVAP